MHATLDLSFFLGPAQLTPPGFPREPAHFLPWNSLVCFSFSAWHLPVAPELTLCPTGMEVVVSGKCASHRVICSYNLGCGGKMHASGLGWCGCVALEEAHVFKEVGSTLGALLLALHLDGENDSNCGHHFRPVSRNSTSDRKCQVPLCPSPLTNPH